jgi:sec-independent protein translocase protein TatA
MGEFSIYHWLIVAAILLLLFGGRWIPEFMKGLGEGIRSFKEGITGKPSVDKPGDTTDRGARNDSSGQNS